MGRKKHPDIDAHEIVPGLWQGSIPPEGQALAVLGFDCLVLCAKEFQPPAKVFPGLRVIHSPNEDNSRRPADRRMLAAALASAREVTIAIQQGHACLVTCAAGMNRSGLVSAMVLHLLHNWAGPQCVAHVRERRGPHRLGITPLSNPQFVKALAKLKPRPGAEVIPAGWSKRPSGLLLPED